MPTAANKPTIVHQLSTSSMRARAFNELESPIDDLRRAALLALQQLHRALEEVDLTEENELAIFAVDQVFRLAKGLEDRWLELHDESCQTGRAAAA
jgi:hypothetical protein